ncbi:hypothetical protein KIL84_017961 [Mauremys mutica]|uniref:Uncharacterized protein n=1 Tax=Mauremys mutica TaxID=74926 RepID=A0A9D3XSF4_9SAUR|nr:hypothetical protein KIL84_017961 [Mauremys mutica]
MKRYYTYKVSEFLFIILIQKLTFMVPQVHFLSTHSQRVKEVTTQSTFNTQTHLNSQLLIQKHYNIQTPKMPNPQQTPFKLQHKTSHEAHIQILIMSFRGTT